MTAGAARLAGVDATRGVALLAMMAVHVLPPEDPDGSLSLAYEIASGRAAATFALLAGVGLALAHGRRRPPVGRRWAAGAAGLVVRAGCIGVLGLLLGYAASGVAVILAYYGVLFALAVPLLGLRPPALVGVAVLGAVAVPVLSHAWRADLPAPDRANPVLEDLAHPVGLLRELLLTGYYPALPWLAYLAAGLAVGRLALGSVRVQAALLAGGAALALGATAASDLMLGPLGGRAALAAELPGLSARELDLVLDAPQFGTTPTGSWWWLAVDAPHASTPPDLLATTGTGVALLGAVLLLVRVLGRLLEPVAAAGSMTLTLYSLHVLWLATGPLPRTALDSWLLQCVVLVAAAWVWRVTVGRGPLEGAVGGLAAPARDAVLAR